MEKKRLNRFVVVVFVTGLSLAIFASPTTTPVAVAQQSEPAAKDAEASPEANADANADASAETRGIQGCAIKAHKISKSGPIRGKVTATNCRGWTVWYGMQVHRWHGWTRIAGKDAFAGKSGKRTYTVKACKKGTFNYRMYISRNGGFPRTVTHVHSGSVRRKC